MVFERFSLKVASQLLLATNGPMKAVEGGLDQRSHDAAHVHLISTAVPLTIVLHPQPATNPTDKPKTLSSASNGNQV